MLLQYWICKYKITTQHHVLSEADTSFFNCVQHTFIDSNGAKFPWSAFSHVLVKCECSSRSFKLVNGIRLLNFTLSLNTLSAAPHEHGYVPEKKAFNSIYSMWVAAMYNTAILVTLLYRSFI